MATVNALSVALFNAAAGAYAADMAKNPAAYAVVVGAVLEKDLSADAAFVEHLLVNFGVATDSAVYEEAQTALLAMVAGTGRANATASAIDFLAAQTESSPYAAIATAFAAKVAAAAAFTTANATETDVSKLIAAVTGVDTDEVAAAASFAAGAASRDTEVADLTLSVAALQEELNAAEAAAALAAEEAAEALEAAEAAAALAAEEAADALEAAEAAAALAAEEAAEALAAAQTQLNVFLDQIARTLDVDGETITVTGADQTVQVAGLTPQADEFEATVSATGTGTLTFNFVDADDVVVLSSDSEISGYTTLNIVGGTVDITAVDISDIENITIASGIKMSVVQIVALPGTITASNTARVEVVVMTAKEVAAVTAVLSKVQGAGEFDLVLGEDADEDLDIVAANNALDIAIVQDSVATVLPGLLDTYLAAQTAVSAFLTSNAENELLESSIFIADADAGATATEVRTAIGVAKTAAAAALAAAELAVPAAQDALDIARATSINSIIAGLHVDDDAELIALLQAVPADILGATSLLRDAALTAAVTKATAAIKDDETEYLENGETNAALLEAAILARATADELQATADETDAVALRTTADELQATADETDAVALRTTADELQDTADETDAVALRTTADESPEDAEADAAATAAEEADAAAADADATVAELAAEATFTALELQTAATAAANAVTTFIAENGANTEILQELRIAISAFFAAEGDPNTEVDGGTETIASLRTKILTLLNETHEESDIVTLISKIAVMELAPAKEDEPTATEQAIIDLFELAADRVALDEAAAATEAAFDLTATGSVLNTVLDLAAERTALIDAVTNAAADLVEATATVAAVTLLAKALEDLDTAEEEALAAIQADAPVGLGVVLLDDLEFTEVDDLLLLNLKDADSSGEIALAEFGFEGNDQIYVGTGYSLVAIGENQDINDNVGNMFAIEILYQQVGDDLVLYFEETSFAGNGSTTGDIVTVTLTGVTGEVELSSTGFLTVV